ncbi:hypothetical protein ILYODFUR_038606 [Ilyodon furcidens]|uniref:Uncharacterized protein n=1 Tax=Ilyodon furcidens TaxID=33524 RepID=A0ABV0V9M0_9TELE
MAQLVEENRGGLKGRFGPRITKGTKRQTWEHIAKQVSASFPLLSAPIWNVSSSGTCCNQKMERRLQYTCDSLFMVIHYFFKLFIHPSYNYLTGGARLNCPAAETISFSLKEMIKFILSLY